MYKITSDIRSNYIPHQLNNGQKKASVTAIGIYSLSVGG